jgi:uncharacterized protein affecting Mg2+/Co2+ transport
MKRITILLLVVAVTPGWAQNLLTNPNFTEGAVDKEPIQGWSWDNAIGNQWHYSTDSQEGDLWCGRWNDTGSSMIYQQISTAPGAEYRYRGWVKLKTDTTATAVCSLSGATDYQTNPGDFVVMWTYNVNDEVWAEFNETFIASGSTTTVGMNMARVAGNGKFDNVSLVLETGAPTPTPTPEPTATPSDNLLANWDFEVSDTELTGWSLYNYEGSSWYLRDVGGIGDSNCGAISGTVGREFLYQQPSVSPGQSYRFGAWLWLKNADSVVNCAYSPSGADPSTYTPGSPTGDWAEFHFCPFGEVWTWEEQEFAATGTAVTVGIYGNRQSGACRVDEVILKELLGPTATPSTFVPGWKVYR